MTVSDWPNYTAECEGGEGHVTKMNFVIQQPTTPPLPPEETHTVGHTWLTAQYNSITLSDTMALDHQHTN